MEESAAVSVRFSIRALAVDDFDKGFFQLLGQLTSIDPAAISHEDFSSFVAHLDEHHQVLVIEDAENLDQITGSITILIERKVIHNMGKVAHIEDVVVDNNIRGTGMGKKLINKAVAISKAAGCYKTILDCSEENAGFYEACGFEVKGKEMAMHF